MPTKRSQVVIKHDAGYGSGKDLLDSINRKLSGDMIAEEILVTKEIQPKVKPQTGDPSYSQENCSFDHCPHAELCKSATNGRKMPNKPKD